MESADERFFEALEAAIEEAKTREAEQSLEEVGWWAVHAIRDRADSALRFLGTRCTDLGLRNRSSSDPWRAWCGGQLRMIGALARAAISLELPLGVTAALRERKNFLPMLQAIGEREVDASSVAAAMGDADLSQTLREIDKLESLKLVQTDKQSRRRWVRLTPLGHQAVAQLTDPPNERLRQRPEATAEVDSFEQRLREILESRFDAIATRLSEIEGAVQGAVYGPRPGDIVEGTVTKVVEFGVFVDIGQGRQGLVHIRQMHEERINHPSDLVSVGDCVQVKITRIDGKRITLSMKDVPGHAHHHGGHAHGESAIEHASEVLSDDALETHLSESLERALLDEG